MTRRSPPTPLRLVSGPLPARGMPKHTLPAVPLPAFYAAAKIPEGPLPRSRAGTPEPRMAHTQLPVLMIPTGPLDFVNSGASSPTSAWSSASGGGSGSARRSSEHVRGPWDHSGTIPVPFDVTAVLPPPRPVAVGVR